MNTFITALLRRLFIPAVFALAGFSVARAGTIYWVDWQDSVVEGGVTKYRGKMTVVRPGGATLEVTVKFTPPPLGIAFYQASGGTDFWTNGFFGTTRNPARSPYTSAVVDNIPTGSDIIGLQRAGSNRLEFTDSSGVPLPIASPVFAYVSLNGNGYGFDQDFDILSYGDPATGNDIGFWGSGTSYKNVTTVSGSTQYQLLGTGEPHGVLQFRGSFSTVNWQSLSNEYWNGFTIGVTGLAQDIPIANAGADQAVNANANCQGVVQLSGSVSGSTHAPYTFTWSGSFGTASGPNPTVTLPTGANTVTLTVTDALGSTDTDTVVITVQDKQAPTLNVPAPITVGTTPGRCDAAVSFTVTATDNCGAASVVSTPASGSVFPVGTTVVTSTATDASGNKITKTFTVTVGDTQPPAIVSPGNITVNAPLGTCAANVNFVASATDNCSGVTVSYTQAPGSSFPVGSTAVTATATDAGGNTASVTFTVTVADVTAPTLVLNPVSGPLTSLGSVTTLFTSVAGSPTGGIAHAHGIAYDLERNTVWVTDAELGNDIFEFPATQPHGSTVAALTRLNPPVTATIEGIYYDPSDKTLWYIENNGQITHIDRTGTVLPGGFSVASTVPAGTFGARGLGVAIQGSFVWVDNGNAAYKFVKATGAYTGVSFATGQPCITYDPERHLIWTSHWNDKRFRAFNTDTGALVFTSAVINPPLSDRRGHLLSIGAGKIWVSTEEVVPGVNDGNREVIYGIEILGGAINKIVECSTPFVDPGATATDACGTATVQVTGSVNTAAVGTYSLTYVAVDASGNASAPQTRTITVIDTTPPLLACPPNQTVSTDAGKCTAAVAFAANASDTCGPVTLSYTASGATTGAVSSGSVFNKGVTTVTVVARDSHNNTSACSFTITVVDSEKPVVTPPADLALNAGPACTAVGPFVATATDNCSVASLSYSHASGTAFPLGTTVVTVTVTDAAGNTGSATFKVVVSDVTAPAITVAAAGKTVECDGAGNTAALTAWLASNGGAVATDPCSAVTWSNNFRSLAAGCGATGSATVVFTATDASGNSSSTTATFAIVDTTKPVITAAADKTVECDGAGNTAALAAWLASNGGATASDTCGSVTWSNNFSALTDLCGATGAATVTFTATDACGNSTSTTASFTIVDTTAPTITSNVRDFLPSEVTLVFTFTGQDLCGAANVTLAVSPTAINGAGKAIDKSGSVAYTIAGNQLTITDSGGVGTIWTITATAVDDCGNRTVKSAVANVLRPANEGVGNGVDGNTPGAAHNGNNDGPGTSPGNPGAKSKKG